MVNPHDKKCAHVKFYENFSYYAKQLRTFVEMGVVRSITTVKSKLEDQGNMFMLLGYAKITLEVHTAC